ncbi:MAG: threonine synthase [Dokdonella sp.]|nr:threonine synthase [Dokdonella sp.]
MNYLSTRGRAPAVDIDHALAEGLAPDGWLYVTQVVQLLDAADFAADEEMAAVAARVLHPFFAGSRLQSQLPAICAEAYAFPASLRALDGSTHLLELFHGPTAAFKDYAARFLAASLGRLRDAEAPVSTVLVATSGDTGAAVAAAFHRRPGFRVVVLYPDGRVSPRQAHQLGSFGENVHALRVAGAFDDCQALVKRALIDADLRQACALTSANSISLGRWLPQMAYYAASALACARQQAAPLNYVIPTGNLGNALACVLARLVGLPIGDIVLATNANRVLPAYFASGSYAPAASIATLANAMDVGDPSNFERLRWLYPTRADLPGWLAADAVDDVDIAATIERTWRERSLAVCPHTATALCVLARLRARGEARACAAVATAHAAKFDSIVEPLIGQPVAVPPALAAMLARPAHAEPIANDYAALRARLLALPA